jgi:hypothetical protein
MRLLTLQARDRGQDVKTGASRENSRHIHMTTALRIYFMIKIIIELILLK